MAVNKLLPVGTKVRITVGHAQFNVGDTYTVIEVEDHLDGSSHRINEYSRNGNGWWVMDDYIEVVEEAPQEMKRKKVTFAEIVQMIAEGTVPNGAVFRSDDAAGTAFLSDVSGSLEWKNPLEGEERVQANKTTTTAIWYMETPEVKLSALEAMTELQKGKSVRGVYDGDEYTLSPYTDFDDIWDDSPWADMDDLLNKTDFYKVAA
ncbi:hypothetical protein [Enterococcus gallinarum]|uniref:hypothetical protein n=1 Tax=Enterococcus gallinarum TaxID=1353 RepID=UPI00115A77D5|nr:hypothetical protein [Enterococcus gallinarum]